MSLELLLRTYHESYLTHYRETPRQGSSQEQGCTTEITLIDSLEVNQKLAQAMTIAWS